MTALECLTIVVPVRDEEGVLEELHRRLSAACDGVGRRYEIIYVDDGSTDRSLEILQGIAAASPHAVVLQLTRNFGQTAALAAGIDHAGGGIIITMDGDLQDDPADIPRFLGVLEEGFDIVIGWRRERSENLWLRLIPSKCANLLMSWFSGVRLKDFGSTFKACRADIIKQVELFGELHRFIPVLADRIGARMTEIPVSFGPRYAGVSKYGFGRVFGVFQDLIFLYFYSQYITKPLRGFGKLFFFFFGTGFVIALIMFIYDLTGRITSMQDNLGMLLFTVLMMILGMQFLVAGVLAELLSRIYFRTADYKIYAVRRIIGGGAALE